jgi:aminoglycoside phosphotransferase (APT) family kinase protein
MKLDIEEPERLVDWLRATGRMGDGVAPVCRPLSGGVSNRVMLVELPSGERWVLKQALARLRVASEWFSPPERVHREALGLRWLQHLTPAGSVVRFLWEDLQEHVLAMEAAPADHENWKTRLLRGEVEAHRVEAFGRLLGTLHRRSQDRAEELTAVFGDRGYFESLRLEPYYGRVAETTPRAAGFMRELIEETRAVREALVHGDYSPKNVLLTEDRTILVDHEVMHWGDPAFDLGFAMTHFLAKSVHCGGACESFLDAVGRFWRAYLATADRRAGAEEFEARAVRHTLGCLLARVAGRSPLEYLSSSERAAVQEKVLKFQNDPPHRAEDLVRHWRRVRVG